MIKQVIAVRKDLGMRKGKVAAQVAHAAMKVFFNRMEIYSIEHFSGEHLWDQAVIKPITPAMKEWMTGSFTKVVVSVNSEEEVYELARQAEKAELPFSIIVDNGFTEFHGNKTTTCVAIGPAEAEEIDKITKELPLL